MDIIFNNSGFQGRLSYSVLKINSCSIQLPASFHTPHCESTRFMHRSLGGCESGGGHIPVGTGWSYSIRGTNGHLADFLGGVSLSGLKREILIRRGWGESSHMPSASRSGGKQLKKDHVKYIPVNHYRFTGVTFRIWRNSFLLSRTKSSDTYSDFMDPDPTHPTVIGNKNNFFRHHMTENKF